MNSFPSANAPDVLRAAQKDTFYSSQLKDSVMQVASSFFGMVKPNKKARELN
jgi:hypothetical protein